MAPCTCVWVTTWGSRTSPDTILVRRRRPARTSSSATTSFASSRVATAGWSRRASPTRRTPTSACSACSSRWSASGRSAVAPRIGTTSASTRSPGSGSGPPPRRRPGASTRMKGVVLAGGLGTRLLPLTRITNKHLLPVFDRPMIFYPIQALINAGITDILIVTGGQHAGDFLRLPKSDYAVTGLYLYDARVFDVIRTLKPSTRGELEITDVNNWYLARGELLCEVLEGWWSDAGTFGSLHRAGNLVARTGANRVDGPATRLPPG